MSSPNLPKPSQEHLEELMAGYALDALSDAEKAAFEAQLQEDPSLVQQLQEWHEVCGLLAHSTQCMPPEKLRNQIAAIPHTTQTSAVVSVGRSHRRSAAWLSLGGTIAAVTIAALGFQNYQLQRQVQSLEAKMLEEAQEAHKPLDFVLKGVPVAVDAQAKVVIDPYTGSVLMAVESLPPLPEGEAYHLWAFTKDDQKVLCGRFNTPTSGQTVQSFAVDAKMYESGVKFLRISQEPAVTPPDPSRRVLLLTSES
jgi:anti-sigma-K factor RskA